MISSWPETWPAVPPAADVRSIVSPAANPAMVAAVPLAGTLPRSRTPFAPPNCTLRSLSRPPMSSVASAWMTAEPLPDRPDSIDSFPPFAVISPLSTTPASTKPAPFSAAPACSVTLCAASVPPDSTTMAPAATSALPVSATSPPLLIDSRPLAPKPPSVGATMAPDEIVKVPTPKLPTVSVVPQLSDDGTVPPPIGAVPETVTIPPAPAPSPIVIASATSTAPPLFTFSVASPSDPTVRSVPTFQVPPSLTVAPWILATTASAISASPDPVSSAPLVTVRLPDPLPPTVMASTSTVVPLSETRIEPEPPLFSPSVTSGLPTSIPDWSNAIFPLPPAPTLSVPLANANVPPLTPTAALSPASGAISASPLTNAKPPFTASVPWCIVRSSVSDPPSPTTTTPVPPPSPPIVRSPAVTLASAIDTKPLPPSPTVMSAASQLPPLSRTCPSLPGSAAMVVSSVVCSVPPVTSSTARPLAPTVRVCAIRVASSTVTVCTCSAWNPVSGSTGSSPPDCGATAAISMSSACSVEPLLTPTPASPPSPTSSVPLIVRSAPSPDRSTVPVLSSPTAMVALPAMVPAAPSDRSSSPVSLSPIVALPAT